MTVTYYHNDGPAANGRSYSYNLRRYGAVCASNHHPLGTVLILTAVDGQRVRVTVCDRVGHGTDYDLDPRTFRRLWPLRKGRGRARARVVRGPHKARKHSARKH